MVGWTDGWEDRSIDGLEWMNQKVGNWVIIVGGWNDGSLGQQVDGWMVDRRMMDGKMMGGLMGQ